MLTPFNLGALQHLGQPGRRPLGAGHPAGLVFWVPRLALQPECYPSHWATPDTPGALETGGRASLGPQRCCLTAYCSAPPAPAGSHGLMRPPHRSTRCACRRTCACGRGQRRTASACRLPARRGAGACTAAAGGPTQRVRHRPLPPLLTQTVHGAQRRACWRCHPRAGGGGVPPCGSWVTHHHVMPCVMQMRCPCGGTSWPSTGSPPWP